MLYKNATEQRLKHFTNPSAQPVAPPNFVLTPAPDYTYRSADREKNEIMFKNYLRNHGYNEDGSKPAAMRLMEDKTFNKFADNIALPTLEIASYISGFGEASSLLKLSRPVINSTAKKSAAELAIQSQGKGIYSGIDKWKDITLSEGKHVVGGLPGQSSYYTTLSGLERSNLNKSTLFEGLQVAKHPQFGYRGQVGIYRVTEIQLQLSEQLMLILNWDQEGCLKFLFQTILVCN